MLAKSGVGNCFGLQAVFKFVWTLLATSFKQSRHLGYIFTSKSNKKPWRPDLTITDPCSNKYKQALRRKWVRDRLQIGLNIAAKGNLFSSY